MPFVLVVDDDESSRYLTVSVLRGAGFDTAEAADGFQALEAARDQCPDIVVSDVMMPRMDGYRLLAEWRDDERVSSVPFVVLTASYTDPADERLAMHLGADAFLTRPLDPADLASAVREVFDAVSSGTRKVAARRGHDPVAEYDARIVAKLEQKARELSAANAALKDGLRALAERVEAEKRLSEELVQERDTQRQVLANANVVALVLDAEGRVLVSSRGAQSVSGYSEEELRGRVFHELVIPPADGADRGHGLGSRSQSRGRLRTASGDVRELDLSITEIRGPDGDLVGHIGFGIDVTEQRRTEQLKHDFVAMVSHELRTPLTAVIGFADLLAGCGPDERLRDHVREVSRVREAGARMLRLVEDLLEVSEVQAHEMRLEAMPCDLGALAVRRVEAVDSAPQHVLAADVEDDVVAVADCVWLGRAVDRLIHNALKFSPDGGAVTVIVRAEGEEARLTVEDHGVGMSPEERDRIFEAFTQNDMSQTRPFGGMGLGLYLVSAITVAHGGRVEVESAPGEGSAFSIVLPLARR